MSDSILTSTKDALGLADDYTIFDAQIIMFINSTLGTINQLGIGPENGLSITDKTTTWNDLTGGDNRYEGVKAYMYLCVRMLFDPPTIGYVITSMEKLKEQAEWRLNRAREDIDRPWEDADERVVSAVPSPPKGKSVPLDVQVGLPFSRQIRITDGKNIWTNLDDFEARMEIHETQLASSPLLKDFTPYLVKSFEGNDILINWALTGSQTRDLPAGYFDLVVSDTGTIDARAIVALHGYINLVSVTTSVGG